MSGVMAGIWSAKVNRYANALSVRQPGCFTSAVLIGALGKSGDVASELARHLQGRMQGIALLGAAYSDTEFITREVRQLTDWLEEL